MCHWQQMDCLEMSWGKDLNSHTDLSRTAMKGSSDRWSSEACIDSHRFTNTEASHQQGHERTCVYHHHHSSDFSPSAVCNAWTILWYFISESFAGGLFNRIFSLSFGILYQFTFLVSDSNTTPCNFNDALLSCNNALWVQEVYFSIYLWLIRCVLTVHVKSCVMRSAFQMTIVYMYRCLTNSFLSHALCISALGAQELYLGSYDHIVGPLIQSHVQQLARAPCKYTLGAQGVVHRFASDFRHLSEISINLPASENRG